MQNLSGQKLGNYELRERLGRGGMAEVYKAYQPSMDRFVAVKIMLGHLAEDDSFIVRFKREAQAVGRLRHPHIIDIFDFGIENDIYYMVMEYLTDGDLKQYITSNSKLLLQQSLKILRDLADALAYAHEQGMIHRDLKPANVMFVDKDKLEVALTDFGIARIINATALTGTGMAVGTPAYMSPEAGAGDEADERTDIYALGVILYEMLVGAVPYSADTPIAVIMKHINAPLPTRDDYGDNIPEAVEKIMLKCLAKDPNDRYATARILHRDVVNAMRQLENFATTDNVPTQKPATQVASANKTRTPVLSDPDAPTTMVDADETLADTIADPVAPKQSTPLLTYGMIVIVVIVLLGGGFFAYDEFLANNTPDDPAEAQVIDNTNQETPETPDETVQPTPAPDDSPQEIVSSSFEDTLFESELIWGGELPPQEVNLNVFSNISEIMNTADEWVVAGDRQGAIFYVDSILENNPDNPDALFARSIVYSQAWDDDFVSMHDAERLIELDPDSVWGYIALSDSWLTYPALEDENAIENAVSAIEQAFAIDPDNPHVLYRLASLGEWEDSIDRYYQAEANGGSGYRFMRLMGDFLFGAAEYNRALPYYETLYNVVDLDEGSAIHVYWRVAGSLLNADRSADALAFVQDSGVADTISDSVFFIDAAFVAYSAGNFDLAEEWANNALTFSDDAHGANYILALVDYYRDGDADSAMERLNALEDIDFYTRFLNFEYGVDVNVERARILYDEGDFEQSLEFYDLVVEDYYQPWLFAERAEVHIALGNRDLARQDLQTAFDISPDEDFRADIRARILELGPSSDD